MLPLYYFTQTGQDALVLIDLWAGTVFSAIPVIWEPSSLTPTLVGYLQIDSSFCCGIK